MCLILAFSPWRHDPTTLNLKISGLHLGCLADNELVVNVARILSLAGGIAVFIIGWIHIIVQDFNWCSNTTPLVDCIGPSLRWNEDGQPFLRPVNGPGAGGWGDQIFTFAVDIFFSLWGPIALGYFTILQHMQGHSWQLISASWPRVFFWFLFLGLFSAMGYAGNLGVLVGFGCIGVATLALAITLGGGANTRTHLEIHVYNFGRNRVTMTSAGVIASEDEAPRLNRKPQTVREQLV